MRIKIIIAYSCTVSTVKWSVCEISLCSQTWGRPNGGDPTC